MERDAEWREPGKNPDGGRRVEGGGSRVYLELGLRISFWESESRV